jgi:cytochrome c oxidase accessory protein FixG
MAADGASLYAAAERIQPRRARGRYARLRILAMLALLGLYYVAPWLELGGHPLVLLDLPHRRFHVFGLTLFPQDLYLLSWLLLIAALTLFLFTSLAGRLWCGYACPQTVWTEAFLWIEHFAEGDRHKRLKLDQAPWRADKILRRGGKHLLWLLLGLWTGLTFVAYFVPARELFPAAAALDLAGWPLFWALFYGAATWGNAGFMREQVCKYMCPYARFQSAMFDRDTLIIGYDAARGEPRKGAARKLAELGPARGDCIDCSICVQVCPTGIDIRKGLQYECIACAACVDACDEVMDNVGKPRGLIHYTSESRDAGERVHWLRPRTIGYGLVWLAVCAGFAAAVLLRNPLELDVIRYRTSLYRVLPDGAIENVYTMKVANKDARAHAFALSVALDDGTTLQATPSHLTLSAGEARSVTVSVRAAADTPAAPVSTAHFALRAEDEPRLHISRRASFLAAARAPAPQEQ